MASPALLVGVRVAESPKMKRSFMMNLLYWLAVLAAIWIALVFLVRWAEPYAAFSPMPGPTPPSEPFERFEVTTEDGVGLVGWKTAIDPQRPVLLYLCGNAGNIANRRELLAGATGRGMSVITVNYRGTGESGGSPTEEGLYRDATAVYDYLVREFKVDPRMVVVWGHSIGGAIASELTLRRLCAGLILESTFRSARVMARRMIPWFPTGLFMSYRLDNEAALARIDIPVFIIHGADDRMVPVADARILYDKAGSSKELWVLDGGEHNDNYITSGEDFYRRITAFAERSCLADSTPSGSSNQP